MSHRSGGIQLLIRRGFKFELRPNGMQIQLMMQFCGCARYVYNRTLSLEKSLYKKDSKHSFKYSEAANRLPGWKKKNPFLKKCHSQVLQQSLKDLDRAYTNFFEKRGNVPKYKKKYRHDSIRFPQGVELDEVKQQIRLPKIGWMGYQKSRDIIGTIKNVTVSRRGEKWDVSIQTEYEVVSSAPNPSEIGIDMGVKRFATLSNGDFVEPLNAFKQEQEKLAKLQRKLARQKKGSRNSRKTKRKIARLHRYIADSRRDFLHKTSTKIAKNHSIICVEDLKVSNMSASARGTKESPGKNVKQKSGLNRSILDQGWYGFFQMLSYKLEQRGGKLIKVDPRNTSRTCPRCGLASAENRKSQATFACIGCGYRSNADEVGAINILRAGRARLACETSGAVRPLSAGTQRNLLQH
ncbi:RNA-guided endonuclease InsQ/TnpB family protein [Parasutterella sp.]|uniref:RNA-guided endonuclease InsQ/TnpB family protein n=1 Tax=Parasutterella sp. TaxID=2049037 RepID=UPI003522C04E